MKKILFAITVALMVLAFPISAFAADTDTKVNSILEDATEYNGNYYLIIKGSYTWEQAKLYCEGLGGHLATITSKGEDIVCVQLWETSNTGSCWLGGSDVRLEGVWEWVTGEPWVYSDWDAGEPNGGTFENYLNYYDSNGKWNDDDLSAQGTNGRGSFICEWEKEDVDYVKKTYGCVSSSEMIYNDAFFYAGNVYKVFKYDMSYEKAKSYCEQLGGHLATISSANEDRAVFAYVSLAGNYNCELGGTDLTTEGLWEWVTGEPLSYANWGTGEPSNSRGIEDHLEYGKDGKWNDTTWGNCFLCEWDGLCIRGDGTIAAHSLSDPQITTPATCTTVGELKRVCSGCGFEIKEEIGMEPHAFPEWETVVEVTCHTAGLNEGVCTLCGVREQRTVEPLKHQYEDWVVVKGSKLIPPIVKERKCHLCGEIDRIKDWSYVWITTIALVALIGVGIGVINYIKGIKKPR